MTQNYAPPAPLQVKLWPSVWKLLRLRGVILVSNFRRAKLRSKIGTIVLGLLLLGGMAVAFFLSWLLLRFLRSPELTQIVGIDHAFLANIPVLVVSLAFVMILITSFGVLLQALYLAGDMDFLLSAPIPIRAIFISKLLQAILPNFGLVLLFGLPVLYGLGFASGYNWLYYPLVLIILSLLALAAAGLASLLVMAVVRVFPARRVAEILGFLAAILSIICSQSGQFTNEINLSGEQAAQAFSMVSQFNTPWSPLAWAGRGLYAIGERQWVSGVSLTLLTIGLTSACFALSLVSAERLYYTGWASVQVSIRKKRSPRPRRNERAQQALQTSVVEGLIPVQVRGIIAKDFLMLRRDLRNMSQLVTPLIFGIIYGFLLLRRGGVAPEGRGEAPEAFMVALENLMVYASVGLSIFVGWSLLSRLALMSFSQEGRQYWLLKSAPISAKRLLVAKYLVAYLPTLGLGLLFLLAISILQKTSPGLMIYNFLVLILIMAGLAALSLAFGVLGANFDWEDPRRISQGKVGCFSVIASFAFLGLGLVFFFGPSILVSIFGLPQAAGQLIGLLLGGVFSLAAGFVPLWLVRERVPLLDEA